MPDTTECAVEIPSLFDSPPSRLALLSTYQFDPDYFEHVLLRRRSLAAARRIAVFIDAGAYAELVRSGAPARHINRRYLMVPVDRFPYVFHPKLTLLLEEEGGRVLCGSHNLTRAGCAANLELTACVAFGDGQADRLDTARKAFRFFRSATDQAEAGSRRIVSEWLEEATKEWDWLDCEPTSDGGFQLLQSYERPLWPVLREALQAAAPQHIVVVSPYYDRDARLVRRLAEEFSSATIELVVQQNVTTLTVPAIDQLEPRVSLSELILSGTPRRLHAKLVLWRGTTTGGLFGSANLTTAAFDGGNAEACLLVHGLDDDCVFGDAIGRRPLRLEEFVSGDDEPESEERDLLLPRLESVVLSGSSLQVAYARVPATVDRMRLELRTSDKTFGM